MAHTYTRLTFHVIFSTKNRLPYLIPESRERVFAYIGGILRELRCDPLHINGISDHVHLVFHAPAGLSLAAAIQHVKGNSTKWIHENGILQRAFSWQRGYSGFSVSESNVARVCQYVAGQELHHRRISFQDELRAFLRQHGIEHDERYLWN